MVTPIPATPGPEGSATPGSVPTVVTPPAGTSSASTQTGQGENKAGIVTLTVEQYQNLKRDAARGRSPKGSERTYQRPAAPAAPVDPNDPAAVERAARIEAEGRALRLEVQGKVRDLLADERFKALPDSTKKIILDAPYALTQADTLDEAMADIEDKLIELSGNNQTPTATITTTETPTATTTSAPRETPPVRTAGAPAPVDHGVIEDTSNLRGPARSTATLRNVFKKQANGGGGE